MIPDITIINRPQREIYGLWEKSNDKTIAKDIPALSRLFYDTVEQNTGSVLPFYVLSKNYDKTSGTFDLFIGSETTHHALESFLLPEGIYGRVTVKPKLGFLWGFSVGKAKRYFYSEWLPSSQYTALNIEYEYHTEKSIARKPQIDLFFAIKSSATK